jgi:hypothetical protein
MAHSNNDNDLAPFRGGFFVSFFRKSTQKIHIALKVPSRLALGCARSTSFTYAEAQRGFDR